MKSAIETFNYQEVWLRNAFHNGKSAIDSLFISDILGTGWSSPLGYLEFSENLRSITYASRAAQCTTAVDSNATQTV